MRVGQAAFLVAIFAAAAAPASAQPRPGDAPNPVVAPAPLFLTGAADWSCGDGRCRYVRIAGAPSFGWTGCFASWFPTHGGWRKQDICR